MLMSAYKERLYWHIRRLVLVHEDADDVLQNTFIKIYRGILQFEGKSKLYTWMYRIVMNLAIDHIRKQKRSRPVEATDEHLREGNTDVINQDLLPLHLGSNPSRMLFDKQVRGRLEVALGQLSENHRAVLVMRELDGMSYEEMASIMSCSKGTIMSRLFHARRNMQRQLSDLVDGAPVHGKDGDDTDADAGGEPNEQTETSKRQAKADARIAVQPRLAKIGGAS